MLRLSILAAAWIVATMSMVSEGLAQMKYALVIHGGAGSSDSWPAERRAAVEKSLQQVLQQGREMLQRGDHSLDVVESVIRALEDDPLFNAGRGAVFNSEGKHELDASIMDGRDRSCGAVGGVTTVKNPISLARLVMTRTPHVLLVGPGAEQFATAMNVARVDPDYFGTDEQRADWNRTRAATKTPPEEGGRRGADKDGGDPPLGDAQQGDSAGVTSRGERAADHLGTVGCVALDQLGNLAAGTSTGGLQNKRFGRIGDSPIVGAGTFADNESVGISCTGRGEDFIRNSTAHHIAALVSLKGLELDEAVATVLHSTTHPLTGGIIAIDRQGNVTMQFNTGGMSRAYANSEGKTAVVP